MKKYFYKSGVRPEGCESYNYSTGVAEFSDKQPDLKWLLFHGTEEEFEAYRKTTHRPVRARAPIIY